MSSTERSTPKPSLVAWVRAALRDPLASNVGYFDNLSDRVRSSAPVCPACR